MNKAVLFCNPSRCGPQLIKVGIELRILVPCRFDAIESLVNDLNDLHLILEFLLNDHPRFVVGRAYEVRSAQLHHKSKNEGGST